MSTTVSYKGSTIATINNNTKTLTTAGKYLEADVILTDSSTTTLQNKSVSPTESQQTINADSGYDGLGTVTVGAISSSYVGSGITQRSSSDLTSSGNTITAPSGYYASQASKAVASGTEGTPSAIKGTVSNNSISVTPSVTNTEGYISGGTKTGTAVTVSASELDSGTKSITENGTGIDVVGYASVDVNVSGSGQQTKIIIPEQTITTSNTYTQITLFTEGFVIGEEYIYTINGTTLTTTCRDFYGSNMVGNTSTNTFFEYTPNIGAMYFTVNDSSLYGTYTIKVEQAIDTNGYTRTIVIPQQTVTPTSNDTYYQASLLMDDVLEEGSDYIITYNGTEYFFTCVVLWGTNYLLGDVNYFFGGTGHSYPFGIIWTSSSTCTLAVDSDVSRTVKVEKVVLLENPINLTTKTITQNGTYDAEDDNADGYSEVTVNVQGGAFMTEVANTYGTELVITSAPGSAPSATRHTIYFEFEDETTETEYAYYDDSFISSAVTATTPATRNNKTVTSAQLDGVEWYSYTPTPTPSGNWTTIYDGTLQTQNGMDIISELSDWYFTDGVQYRVTIDGTPYTCTAETNETGAVLIGNFDLYNDITASGEYPFLCFNVGWGGVYVYLQNGGNTTHTFKLEEEQKGVI